MQYDSRPTQKTFGLLPEPERNPASIATSAVINLSIVALLLWAGTQAHKVVMEHRYEQTTLILPTEPPPPPPPPIKLPPIPKMDELQPPPPVEAPKIVYEAPKPEPKPIQDESKLNLPAVKPSQQQKVTLAPQPKAALAAAMPAQSAAVKASTAPVRLGQTFGVMPNANATRPANVAAIGNPYGNMQGAVGAPHGVVGSTGLGNGVKAGSSAGVVGHVAQAGIPGATAAYGSAQGHVASAGIPGVQAVKAAPVQASVASVSTNIEVLSKPPVQYTSEAKQLKVQGDVVLRVTFTAQGRVQVQGIVHGLGHGLDEEARRVAQNIRFRPATRNGQPIDTTTNITISFQLA